MSRAEKIAKMATRTAVQAKENSSVKRKRKKAKNGVLFEAHKHCVECSIPIPLSYDALICEDEECKINQEKKGEIKEKIVNFTIYWSSNIHYSGNYTACRSVKLN